MTSLWNRFSHQMLQNFWGRPVRFEKSFLCRGSTGNAVAATDIMCGHVRIIGDDVQLKVFQQAFFFNPAEAHNLAALLGEAADMFRAVQGAPAGPARVPGEMP